MSDDKPAGPPPDSTIDDAVATVRRGFAEAAPGFDPANHGKLDKRTRRLRDHPEVLRVPTEEETEAALAGPSAGFGAFMRQPFDPYDGMTKEQWEAGAAATERDYQAREAERQARTFQELGHDRKFYDLGYQTARPMRTVDMSKSGREVVVEGEASDRRVPVITRREELPGDDGARLAHTATVARVDYDPPFADREEEVRVRVAEDVVAEVAKAGELLEPEEVDRVEETKKLRKAGPQG